MLNTQRIKERLNEKQMTEYRLAKIIGTSTAHMSRLMTGDIKDPRFDFVCKIADALEITVDELRMDKESNQLNENMNPFVRKVKIISKKNSDHLRDGYLAIIPDIKVSSMLPDFDFDGLMTCFDSLDKRDKFDALAYSCLYYRDLLTKAK